uniref:Xylose isomerase domain protein TIM barrel n=1 Tax=Solibacter usitatus (strain Ellin6076) TaxID=234267 RepID=Q025T7_SOLUE
MIRIGQMQGRLSPPEGGRIQFFPRLRWQDEFALAAEAGFDQIEWLYDEWGEQHNPLAGNEGTRTIGLLSKQSGVAVHSLCAHYFVEHPFVNSSGRDLQSLVDKLEWLVTRCAAAKIRRVIVPFLDQGSIRNEDHERCAMDVLNSVLPGAVAHSVELHLETDLAPIAYGRFLEKMTSPAIRATYDTGNSTSFGFDVIDEIAAYGSRIGSVHIKDRLRRGGSVPLGEGEANLSFRLAALLATGYRGDFVLEAARGEAGGELAWARRNLDVVKQQFAKANCLARGNYST